MLFSERLRTLRTEQGLLQREMARAIGVDIPMYSRYEHGERRPKRDQVTKLARLLNTDEGELVAMWLAEEAMNAIGHYPQSARASQLLLAQLAGNDVVQQATEADKKPAVVAVEQPVIPAVDPLIIAAEDLPASQRTLVRSLGRSPMPHYEQGDARQVMQRIEDDSVDCIVTTPPYWNLKDYKVDGITAATLQDFANELLRVMAEAHRVLKQQGSLWLNVADFYQDKALQGFPWRLALQMIDLQGWTLRNDVVWNKPQGTFDGSPDNLRNVHEYLFHFVKSADYYFNETELRNCYNNAMASDKKRTSKSAAGLMPGDVWSIAPDKSEIERYRVAPELLYRIPIAATSPAHGLVLDPYCGTGTACKVAYDMDRRSIGIDTNGDHLARARKRIEAKPLSLF